MRITVPGDKSLTQRALILAGLAEGRSRLAGLLHGGDADSTARALRALGVGIPPLPEHGGELWVDGVGLGGLRPPEAPLDLGNSGTGARLLLGVLAGVEGSSVVTGDESLRRRPMARVMQPLGIMGAGFRELGEAGCLPLEVSGRPSLRPLEWDSPVASAQVKSALLLAGLTGRAFVLLTEPRRSRDHTERMLSQLGAPVVSHAHPFGWRVELRDPPAALTPLDFHVPGDISSAAFPLSLAALGGTKEGVEVAHVGLNPTRTAFLDVLRRMGARVTVDEDAPSGPGEPVGTVSVAAAPLRSTVVGEDEVPALIDELPLIAVLGARAEGETRVTGAHELRHKESDRITALVENLRSLGAEAEELTDGFVVRGSDAPLVGEVRSHGDHRIAMAFGVLGTLPGNDITVDEPFAASVSFPGFWELLSHLTRCST
jgi:3-phosphoshikimate 1-carboxyvinyltransferase